MAVYKQGREEKKQERNRPTGGTTWNCSIAILSKESLHAGWMAQRCSISCNGCLGAKLVPVAVGPIEARSLYIAIREET